MTISVPDTLMLCLNCGYAMAWNGRQYECLSCTLGQQEAAYEQLTGHHSPCEGYNPRKPCTCGRRA